MHDDGRLTRPAPQYRRDLRQGLVALGEAMHADAESAGGESGHMRTTKAKTGRKTKEKTTRKSPVKRPRNGRNRDADRPLSFDPPPNDDMSQQAVAAPRHRVHDSIDRVIAECDKVDAALTEFARQDMPPLMIKELTPAAGGAGATRGWAVMSADLQRPLTEWQARAIVTAMQSPREPAPIGIAAE